VKRAVWVAAVLALGVAPFAQAKCAYPRAFVLPESGTALPPDATIYAFGPYGLKPDVSGTADKASLTFAVTELSATEAFTAYQVRFTASHGQDVQLTISWSDDDSPQRGQLHKSVLTYRIDAAWTPPPGESVAVASIEREAHSWTCSYQQTQNLTLSQPAPAYRIHWAATRHDYEAGRRRSLVFPRQMESFFWWPGAEALPSTGRVELGHVNCTGTTFAWDSSSIWLGATALYEDGTETAVPAQPIRVSRPRRGLFH
jgi:hypothetical protein